MLVVGFLLIIKMFGEEIFNIGYELIILVLEKIIFTYFSFCGFIGYSFKIG